MSRIREIIGNILDLEAQKKEIEAVIQKLYVQLDEIDYDAKEWSRQNPSKPDHPKQS